MSELVVTADAMLSALLSVQSIEETVEAVERVKRLHSTRMSSLSIVLEQMNDGQE